MSMERTSTGNVQDQANDADWPQGRRHRHGLGPEVATERRVLQVPSIAVPAGLGPDATKEQPTTPMTGPRSPSGAPTAGSRPATCPTRRQPGQPTERTARVRASPGSCCGSSDRPGPPTASVCGSSSLLSQSASSRDAEIGLSANALAPNHLAVVLGCATGAGLDLAQSMRRVSARNQPGSPPVPIRLGPVAWEDDARRPERE